MSPESKVVQPDQNHDRFPELIAASDQPVSVAVRPPVYGSLRSVLGRASDWLIWHVKNYRPVRKNIVATSAVLLFIIMPLTLLGWGLVFLITIVVCFVCLGSEQFWRTVISVFQKYQGLNPEGARVLKLRAYAAAKKWDRLLARLPVSMAEMLRVPDLRSVIKADARHDAALSERLNRMHNDQVAGH